LAGGALGQYAGSGVGESLGLTPDQTDVAGDIGALAGGGLGSKARIPTKADIALALRNNETGAVKLPVKVGSAVLGAGTGYLTGLHGYGELGGMYLGPRAAETLIPKLPAEMPAKGIGATLPSAEDFYAARAEDLMARGKQQELIDKQRPAPELGSPENPGWHAKLPTRMPLRRALAPNPFEGMTPTNVPLGGAELPGVLQGNATPFAPTVPHEIPGINAPAGQDLISRTRRISIPGEEPTTADLKRAGDLTQAPLQRLKSLARFGDRLAQIEINRRLKNE
jgi:hypothetical protein